MRFSLIVLIFIFFGAKVSFAQNPTDIENYIGKYKDLAISEMQRSGIPASIILAQGIHETEAGNSDLVRKSNNHFGIKCKSTWSGSVVYHDDDARGECFRSYDGPEDSYKDHSNFLRNSTRYESLFKLDPLDYKSWAYGLKKAGYATNIRYPQILIKLIEDYNLQQYSLIALGKGKEGDDKQIAIQNNTTDSATVKSVVTKNPEPVKYPDGAFEINKSRVVFEKAGTSLLSIVDTYHIPLDRLVDFNDLQSDNVLAKDQLVFLQRKRKTSNISFHIVKEGETLYDISQSEGVRYESILEMNQLTNSQQPAIGQKIYLQSNANARPLLATQ